MMSLKLNLVFGIDPYTLRYIFHVYIFVLFLYGQDFPGPFSYSFKKNA